MHKDTVRHSGVYVKSVRKGSIAEALGITKGARIETINGQVIRDEIDYMYATGGVADMELEWSSAAGEEFEAIIDKELDEDLGLTLCPQQVRTCANRCIFCFVDQMPGGMRETLYVKDDDWRSSFLHGTYVTLTNLTKEDFDRIIEQRISPLYVSVHATDDAVRARLLGTERGRGILQILRTLTDAEIKIQAQAVICEGENDGEVLKRTIDDLFALHPMVQSLSVVPVGLTKFRSGLPDVAAVSPKGAARIIDLVEERQRTFLSQAGTRFVFAADELYLRSGRALPDDEEYEDYAQIENGVGLVAEFERSAKEALEQASRRSFRNVLVLTGRAFAPRLVALSGRIEDVLGIKVTVRAVDNAFFGSTVTVSGLLTGRDIVRALEDADQYDAVFVPEIIFRDNGEQTLDDMSFSQIAQYAGIPCFKASEQGDEFIRQLGCL